MPLFCSFWLEILSHHDTSCSHLKRRISTWPAINQYFDTFVCVVLCTNVFATFGMLTLRRCPWHAQLTNHRTIMVLLAPLAFEGLIDFERHLNKNQTLAWLQSILLNRTWPATRLYFSQTSMNCCLLENKRKQSSKPITYWQSTPSHSLKFTSPPDVQHDDLVMADRG